MAFYSNHSRHSAIVTIHIQSTDNPEKSFQKGVEGVSEHVKADVGYHDFIVEPGQSLTLGENTTAALLGVRGAD